MPQQLRQWILKTAKT